MRRKSQVRRRAEISRERIQRRIAASAFLPAGTGDDCPGGAGSRFRNTSHLSIVAHEPPELQGGRVTQDRRRRWLAAEWLMNSRGHKGWKAGEWSAIVVAGPVYRRSPLQGMAEQERVGGGVKDEKYMRKTD
jgi:hypothetical protein